MQIDREKARERAVKARNKIMAARAALREVDDPKAETLQEEQLCIAADLIALLDEPQTAAPAKDLSKDLESERIRSAALSDSLIKTNRTLENAATVVASLVDIMNGYMPPEGRLEYSCFTLIVPNATIEPNRLQAAVDEAVSWPVDPAQPKQTVVPRSVEIDPAEALGSPPPAVTPAPQVAPATRAAEQDIPIETWNPSSEDLDKLPYDPQWKLKQLAEFKAANKGKTAKRWMTSFRSHCSAALSRLTHPHS